MPDYQIRPAITGSGVDQSAIQAGDELVYGKLHVKEWPGIIKKTGLVDTTPMIVYFTPDAVQPSPPKR